MNRMVRSILGTSQGFPGGYGSCGRHNAYCCLLLYNIAHSSQSVRVIFCLSYG